MIVHKTYKGILKRIGVGSVRPAATRYAVLQVDKHIITNVLIDDKLDSYLDVGNYVELTVVRMPMTFIKVVVVLKNEEITLRSNQLYLYAIWILCALPLFFIISNDSFKLSTIMVIYIAVLAFELWNLYAAVRK